MPRSLQEEYYPSPVPRDPNELPRYLESEFHKIRESLIAQPVALSVAEEGAALVTTVVTWFDLFIDEAPEWDVPGGSFDPVTGIWTCPQQGLHQLALSIEVEPFGSGNKTYYAGVAIDYVGQDGIPGRAESADGGDDAIPLGVTLDIQVPILFGSILKCQAAIVHDQFSGTANYKARLQILRVSN
ncbi:MAG: hypothetical protein DRQ40_08615 [Gammaproteobacteria bacterium]|nr:MAG: hypothetical protein DRQ40_08615 [Gammaproteobacteria bacterium]